MLICSSNLFKVTVIKITFSPPRSKRNSRDVFLMLLPRSSPPLSFIFFYPSLFLIVMHSWLAGSERDNGGFLVRTHPMSGDEKWPAAQTGALTGSLGGGAGHHIKRDRNKQTGQDQGYFFSHILVFLKEIRTCYHHSVHPTSVHVCSA